MKVRDAIEVPGLEGSVVGIECETEGDGLFPIATDDWRSEHDGSLRNGMEYITAPIPPERVKECIQELHKLIKKGKGKVSYSFRCSTHVHLNVTDLEQEQVLSMILLYGMYENVFMNYVDKSRVGNRFCLRFQDAGALVHEVAKFFSNVRKQDQLAIHRLNQNELKYGAINLFTLRKYGTLEFRALEGTADADRISIWVNTLVKLREIACRYEGPQQAYEAFTNDPQGMAEELFSAAPEAFLKAGWKQQVEEAFSQNQIIISRM